MNVEFSKRVPRRCGNICLAAVKNVYTVFAGIDPMA